MLGRKFDYDLLVGWALTSEVNSFFFLELCFCCFGQNNRFWFVVVADVVGQLNSIKNRNKLRGQGNVRKDAHFACCAHLERDGERGSDKQLFAGETEQLQKRKCMFQRKWRETKAESCNYRTTETRKIGHST